MNKITIKDKKNDVQINMKGDVLRLYLLLRHAQKKIEDYYGFDKNDYEERKND